MNPNDAIDQAQETLDWSVKNNQVFMIMFIVVFAILLLVLYIAYKVLIKERAESKLERKEFRETLGKQQDLISAQQRLLEEEKKALDDINLNIRSIDSKMDLVLRKEG